MSSESLSPLVAIREPAAPVPSVELRRPADPGTDFSTLFTQGISHLEQKLQTTQADLRLLAAGQAESVHAVMVNLEETRVTLQLMLQVRNRLLESYQELLRLQV